MMFILFLGMASFAAVFALVALLHRNPIYSAMGMVALLFNTAGLYALLGGEFIAVIQVLVYTGAIVVLFIFVIMLLDLPMELVHVHKVKPYKLLGAGAILAAGGLMVWLLLGHADPALFTPHPAADSRFGGVKAVSDLLLHRYLLPFETIGLLLFAAVVGGVVLGKKRL